MGFGRQGQRGLQSNSDTFFLAPKKFLANKSATYGGTLSYDLYDRSGNQFNDDVAVVIKGGGVTMGYASKTLPTTANGKFTHFVIPMTEKGWTLNELNGKPVSKAAFQKALANVTQLCIRSEYNVGPDDSGLDNVILAGPRPLAKKHK